MGQMKKVSRKKQFKNKVLQDYPNSFDGVNPLDIAFKIVNVVATAALDRPVDLGTLPLLFPHTVVYDPEANPPPVPAYFKSRDMHGKVSIFPSGKMISVGTKSEEEARRELISVATRLNIVNVAKLKTKPKIENMVVTANLNLKTDLERIGSLTEARVIYEPEQFPGAIIRLTLPEKSIATILLFSSGKIVCVGLKDQKNIAVALRCLLERIS